MSARIHSCIVHTRGAIACCRSAALPPAPPPPNKTHLFHIFLSLNSSTRASSGVMVAHLMPTLYFCRWQYSQQQQHAQQQGWHGACSTFSTPHSSCTWVALLWHLLFPAPRATHPLLHQAKMRGAPDWVTFALLWTSSQTLHPGRSETLATHLDGFCCLDSDLVVGGVTVGQAQVEILDVQVKVGQDQLEQEAEGDNAPGGLPVRRNCACACAGCAPAGVHRRSRCMMLNACQGCGMWLGVLAACGLLLEAER